MSFLDASKSFALRQFLGSSLGRYGDLKRCDLDSTRRELTLHFAPLGEDFTIELCLRGYEIVKQGEREFFAWQSLSCNREWAQRLISDHLKGPIPLDPKAASMLKMVF